MLGGSTSPVGVWLCVPKDFITLAAWCTELQVYVVDVCMCVCEGSFLYQDYLSHPHLHVSQG